MPSKLKTTTLALAATTLLSTASSSAIPPPPPTYSNSTTTTTTTPPSSEYSLIASYPGSSFFPHFTAFSGPDPTHGHVTYQSLSSAASHSLLGYIHNSTSNTSTAYIGVDYTTNPAPNGRKSVRLESKQTFEAGSIAVIDVRHAPSQWGVWPAVWFLGSEGTWPEGGESDVLEYVHRQEYNSMTLHTAPNCVVDNATTSGAQQGYLVDGDCNAGDAATGCSVKGPRSSSFSSSSGSYTSSSSSKPGTKNSTSTSTGSAPFIDPSGTLYIHDWQPNSITIWSFPHTHLPPDLSLSLSTSEPPNPSSWHKHSKPLAHFSGTGCDFSKSFRKMKLVINITFCGDWAGREWVKSGAQRETGYETCEEYVSQRGEDFEGSYFEMGGVRVWGRKG